MHIIQPFWVKLFSPFYPRYLKTWWTIWKSVTFYELYRARNESKVSVFPSCCRPTFIAKTQLRRDRVFFLWSFDNSNKKGCDFFTYRFGSVTLEHAVLLAILLFPGSWAFSHMSRIYCVLLRWRFLHTCTAPTVFKTYCNLVDTFSASASAQFLRARS